MGMDLYLYKTKLARPPKNADMIIQKTWQESLEEVYYARKFWALHKYVDGIYGAESGEYVHLNKNDIRKMIDVAIENEDYFGGFNSIPDLCRLYHDYDALKEEGYSIYFECDW